MTELEALQAAEQHLIEALGYLNQVNLKQHRDLAGQVARLEEVSELVTIEMTETHFVVMLQREPADGFGLVDDGTMDTVLSCPNCNGWLHFDGREPAIMFLEDDRECWLCPEGDTP